jgi:hypothetical protein
VSVRSKEDVLSVWLDDSGCRNVVRFVDFLLSFSNFSCFDLIYRSSEKLKEIWNLTPSTRVDFKAHSSSMKDRSTYRNGKLYVVPPSSN